MAFIERGQVSLDVEPAQYYRFWFSYVWEKEQC